MRHLVLSKVDECLLSGLRFVQEIYIIFKYEHFLKILRIVMYKYKDKVMVKFLDFKEILF